MYSLCVIPARGGSKRITRKNIKLFHGKPMLAYAIEAAQSAAIFDHIVVSTEDKEIAQLAQTYGAQVVQRPESLADDHTPTNPVIVHAIEQCEQQFQCQFDWVTCIYPCVPFIQVDDLHQAWQHCQDNPQLNFVFPVTEFPSAIQRALKRNDQGSMSPFFPEYVLTRTQDLEASYYDVGQFYLGRRSAWLQQLSAHQGGQGLVIPSWRAVDIDTEDDWQRAERLYQIMLSPLSVK